MADSAGLDVLFKIGIDDGSGNIVQTALAGQTDVGLSVNGNQIDTTSKDNPDWETHIRGRSNWSLNGDGRLQVVSGDFEATIAALYDAAANGTKVEVELSIGNGPTFSGTVSIGTFDVGGTDGDAANVSWDAQGDGPLAKA